MSRPRSQAEYLARLVPPSVAGLNRRSLLAGAAGAGALLGTGLLAGCGDSDSGSGGRRQGASRSAPTSPTRSPRTSSRRSWTASRPSSGMTVNDQHGRPQHLPGEHQQLPAGQAGRRVHLVRRLPDAVLRRQGPGRRHQRRVGQARRLLRRVQEGVHRRRRQAVLRARRRTTRGRSSTASRCGSSTATRCPRRWTSSTTLGAQMKKDGLDPDRLRRQGRLAGDGHLRHPQPADQRLPVPHRPDGRQGGVDRPTRSRRSSTPGPGCSPCTSRTRSAAPGRRPPSRCSRRRAACTCSACSSPSSSAAPSRSDLDFFTFPEIDSDHRRRRPWTPRSTAT